MTVYVDEPYDYGEKGVWCHMASDQPDSEELHALAKRIGLQKKWFQNHPTHPHYDLKITARGKKNKQILAIEAGAIPVTRREFVLLTREKL